MQLKFRMGTSAILFIVHQLLRPNAPVIISELCPTLHPCITVSNVDKASVKHSASWQTRLTVTCR